MDIERLERAVGHRFRNPSLAREALTHRSRGAPHNERLEFLGDSVLNCIVSIELHGRYPRLREGELSRLRAALVRQESLARVAQDLGLGDWLLLGEGELKSGGFGRPSILADALEAMIGAVFVDAGFERARETVVGLFSSQLSQLDPGDVDKDPKTLLQELLQSRRMDLPQYKVVATDGAAHMQNFEVECLIPELSVRTTGTGQSRRSAEQDAAREALAKIREEHGRKLRKAR